MLICKFLPSPESRAEEQEKKGADLSSVVVDISKAAKESAGKKADSKSSTPALTSKQRSGIPHLQHQSSLSAQAVGAASEAGKFIASKLTNEVNLKGAKEMVMAAASHLTGVGAGGPTSRIKFKNLEGEEDEDEEEEDQVRSRADEAGSSMDDEDDDDDFSQRARQQRLKRNKRGHSVISAALSSYKQKQGGYKKAANEDDFEDEEDDEDEDDENMNLKKSVSFKNKNKNKKQTTTDKSSDLNSSTDERQTPTGQVGDEGQDKSKTTRGSKRMATKKSSSSGRKSTGGGQRVEMKKGGRYEEEDDFDQESGRNYKCLDNSVALLIKTRFEETMLRIAVIAIVFVALGIFILFSLPPTPPAKEVVDMLIANR